MQIVRKVYPRFVPAPRCRPNVYARKGPYSSGTQVLDHYNSFVLYFIPAPFALLFYPSRSTHPSYSNPLRHIMVQLPPLEVIATWPTPNYVDPVTRGWANAIVNIVLYPLVCIALSIRIYTRLRITKSFGWDDWLILLSFVLSPVSRSTLKPY